MVEPGITSSTYKIHLKLFYYYINLKIDKTVLHRYIIFRMESLLRARATFLQYCDERDLSSNAITISQLEGFMTKWIFSKDIRSKYTLGAHTLGLMMSDMIQVIDQIQRPILIAHKRAIKRATKRASGKIFNTRLYQTKKAEPLPFDMILPMVKILWMAPKRKHAKAAAIALMFTGVMGARLGESLTLHWEDLKEEHNELGHFLVCPLRAGKTNKIPLVHQQLTAKTGPLCEVDIAFWLAEWRGILGNPETGLVFPLEVKQKAAAIVRVWNQFIPKEYIPLVKKLGGHSGRNAMVRRCFKKKVPIHAMKTFFGWKPASNMPDYYRATFNECTTDGAAQILAVADFNKKLEKL